MLLGHQVQVCFTISQKDLTVLKEISFIFDKKYVKYNKKGFYYILISDINSLLILESYIKKFPLKTKKHISFIK
jgi:hypothetical protein